MIHTRARAHGCSQGAGHGAWPTAPGVPCLDHWVHTPGLHVIVPCLFETLEAVGLLMHGTAICLKDDVRRRGGTDPRRAPLAVGRAPMGPAHLTDLLSQHKGVQTALVVVASAAGLCTHPGAIAHGCIFDVGAIDGGAIP